MLDIALALLDAFSALEQDGPRAAAREQQRGEQSRGACADDHGARLRRVDHRRQLVKGGRVDADAFIPRAAQHPRLSVKRDGNGIDQSHALARVNAAPENAERADGLGLDAQRRCGARGQQAFALAGGELEPFDLQHGGAPFPS